MKIIFVLHTIGLAGGTKVVFEYANRLQAKGHDVSVVFPLIPLIEKKGSYDFRYLLHKALGGIANLRQGVYVNWFPLKAKLIRVPTLDNIFIPDADVVVATWWETAEYVCKYSKKKGEKFYLIQHYEIWGGPKEEVDRSYKLGLRNIVISKWLKKTIEATGAKVDKLIFNGLNFGEFYPEPVPRKDRCVRILMPYRGEPWRGIEDGLKAFEIVKKKRNNLKLVMFGPKPRKGEIPEYVEFHILPLRDELRRLYNSCDIFLFSSRFEGFGLTPLEAMACRLPVVTTNVGAIPDYTISGKTALVSPPKEPIALANHLTRLIDNEKERKNVANMGYEHVKSFTWDKSVNKLESIFKEYVGTGTKAR